MGIAISSVTLVDILWLQLAPTAARTIGWKYYLVFIALGIVHIIYFWFRLPEVIIPRLGTSQSKLTLALDQWPRS